MSDTLFFGPLDVANHFRHDAVSEFAALGMPRPLGRQRDAREYRRSSAVPDAVFGGIHEKNDYDRGSLVGRQCSLDGRARAQECVVIADEVNGLAFGLSHFMAPTGWE